MLSFMLLPNAIFMSFSLCDVCKMSVTLALFEKNMMHTMHLCTQTSQITECRFGYSVYFLFNEISLNIYLFVKNTLSFKV